MLEHQRETGGPSLRALVELRGGLRRDGLSSQSRHPHDFVRGQRQILARHTRHLSYRPQTREGRRRLVAAGDDHTAALGHLREASLEQGVKFTLDGNGMHIVDDDSQRLGAAREELAEKLPREGRDVAAVQSCERRQTARPLAADLARGVREIVEERCRIRVVRVDLIPDGRKATGLDVACRERGLARSGRSRDPRDGPARRFVEAGEKRVAFDHRSDGRPRRLGERGVRAAAFDHVSPPSRFHLLTYAGRLESDGPPPAEDRPGRATDDLRAAPRTLGGAKRALNTNL